MNSQPTARYIYAGFTARYRAVVIDGFVTVAILVPGVFIASSEHVPESLRWLFIFCAFLYEPLCLSIRGRTVGQGMKRLRVVRAKSGQKLNFFVAAIRYAFKLILGVFSVIFMFVTNKSQALHDLIVGSVVIEE